MEYSGRDRKQILLERNGIHCVHGVLWMEKAEITINRGGKSGEASSSTLFASLGQSCRSVTVPALHYTSSKGNIEAVLDVW